MATTELMVDSDEQLIFPADISVPNENSGWIFVIYNTVGNLLKATMSSW